jgi:hypothetical protein
MTTGSHYRVYAFAMCEPRCGLALNTSCTILQQSLSREHFCSAFLQLVAILLMAPSLSHVTTHIVPYTGTYTQSMVHPFITFQNRTSLHSDNANQSALRPKPRIYEAGPSVFKVQHALCEDLPLPLAHVGDKKVKRFHFSEIIGRLPYMRATVTLCHHVQILSYRLHQL